MVAARYTYYQCNNTTVQLGDRVKSAKNFFNDVIPAADVVVMEIFYD
jgi:hypothetical protein